MKYSEFKRWLQKRGVVFDRSASGSHFRIRYGSKHTIFPWHGSKEMSESLRKDIIKQLGLTP